MTQVKPRFKNLEEYLAYDNGTDTRYEVVNGVLVEMPTENPLNIKIALFLMFQYAKLIPYEQITFKNQIAVDSQSVTAREPDLVIHSDESLRIVDQQKQALLPIDTPLPLLVIEIVSPGDEHSENYQRDCIEKPQEYAKRGIPEFWRIDPGREVVSVLTLSGEVYRVKDFRGDESIESPTFRALNMTAQQILTAGN
jgi:Uma2 family endonuclease